MHTRNNLLLWQGFQAVYDRLGIKGLTERGESVYNPLLPGLVEELMQSNVAELSEGAKVIFVKVASWPLPEVTGPTFEADKSRVRQSAAEHKCSTSSSSLQTLLVLVIHLQSCMGLHTIICACMAYPCHVLSVEVGLARGCFLWP